MTQLVILGKLKKFKSIKDLINSNFDNLHFEGLHVKHELSDLPYLDIIDSEFKISI